MKPILLWPKTHPNLADHHRARSGADPRVVAQAMALDNCPVVEILNACRHFGIQVYAWVEVLRETGFRA